MSKKSEFYSQIIQNTQVLPINCGGAREVVIAVKDVTRAGSVGFLTDTNNIWNQAGDIIAPNYFFLPDLASNQNPLVVHTNDEYLYITADGQLWVQVWVIR